MFTNKLNFNNKTEKVFAHSMLHRTTFENGIIITFMKNHQEVNNLFVLSISIPEEMKLSAFVKCVRSFMLENEYKSIFLLPSSVYNIYSTFNKKYCKKYIVNFFGEEYIDNLEEDKLADETDAIKIRFE